MMVVLALWYGARIRRDPDVAWNALGRMAEAAKVVDVGRGQGMPAVAQTALAELVQATHVDIGRDLDWDHLGRVAERCLAAMPDLVLPGKPGRPR
jgi:hypothetical protein